MMSNRIAAGCSEMVSNDATINTESISIDPDIRHREWGWVLRNPAITPPPESLVETSQQAAWSESGRLVSVSIHSPVVMELFVEEQEADIERLRSDLEALTMKRAKQAKAMTMEQAEIERLRSALEAM